VHLQLERMCWREVNFFFCVFPAADDRMVLHVARGWHWWRSGRCGEVVIEVEVEGMSGVVSVVAEEAVAEVVYKYAEVGVLVRLLCEFARALDVREG
jgi:hypothetical protein